MLYKIGEILKKYNHLTFEDRLSIARYLDDGLSKRKIARIICVHHSTVCDEISRNSIEVYNKGLLTIEYNPNTAQTKYRDRRKRNASKFTQSVLDIIKQELKLFNTFESISGKHRKTDRNFPCSTTLYNWYHNHRFKVPKSYRSAFDLSKNTDGTRSQSNKKSELCKTIHERPDYINSRTKPGHWELDLIESAGKGGYIISFTERMSRFAITKYIDTKHADPVNAFLKTVMDKYKVYSITPDNGSEFLKLHEIMTVENRLMTYYCDPGKPQQKGQVEHFNKDMRRYVKKKEVFTSKNIAKIKKFTTILNNKATKLLNYKTPADFEYLILK